MTVMYQIQTLHKNRETKYLNICHYERKISNIQAGFIMHYQPTQVFHSETYQKHPVGRSRTLYKSLVII